MSMGWSSSLAGPQIQVLNRANPGHWFNQSLRLLDRMVREAKLPLFEPLRP